MADPILESFFTAPGELEQRGPVDPDLARLITFDPGEQVDETRGVGDELGRGIGAGIQETQAGLYGFAQLIGQITGSEAIQEYGREGALRNLEESAKLGPEINSLADVGGVSDFFKFAAGGLGKGLPSIGASLTGGGIAAAVARKAFMSRLRGAVVADARASLGAELAGRLGRSEIDNAVRAALRQPSVNRMLANVTAASAGLGSAAPTLPIEAGGIVTDLDQQGLEAPFTALLGGTLASALDAAPVARLITKMFPTVPPAMARGFVSDLATTMGSQAALEGSTEAAQELVAMAALAYHDPDFDPLDNEGLIRLVDAAAIGALVGAVSGGAGSAVSQVTNRAADTTNRIRAGGERLRTAIRDQVVRDLQSDSTDPAEPLIPGWSELTSQVADGLTNAYQRAVSGLRERAAAGLDSVIQDANGAPNASLARIIEQAEDKLRRRVLPEMQKLNARVRDTLTAVRDRAKTMGENERTQYVRAKFDELQKQVSSYIQDRFGRIVGAVESETAERINTENLPDEDSFGFEDDTTETGLEAFETTEIQAKRTFGKTVRTQYPLGRGELTDPVAVRSRGDDAQPFGSREAAERAAEELRASYPNVGRDAIQVTEVDKGYLVSIFDEGAAEEIFQQERTNDTLTKAFAIGRKKNRETNTRVAMVRRPGSTAPSPFDVPTLALGGEDVAERGGIQLGDDKMRAALRGLDTILGRMIAQGYEIVGGVEALNSRELLPGLTVGEARAKTGRNWTTKTRAQVGRERNLALLKGTMRNLGDRGPKGDRVINITLDGRPAKEFVEGREQPSFETQTPEERARETEDEQAAKSARDRASTMTMNKVTPSPSNKNVRVGLLGQSQERRDRVTQLVSDIAKLVGLRDKRFIIVDRKGAEALLASNDFPSNWKAGLLQVIANDVNGKIMGSVMHGDGARKVIYLSDRAWERESTAFRTLFHELGHVVQRSHFDNLPLDLQVQMSQDHRDSGSPLEFNEWMADQFVAWAVRDRRPRTTIERFFSLVRKALSQFFNAFQQRFPLSETFEQFMKGVAGVANADADVNEWGRALLAQRFKDQGLAAKPGKLIIDVETENLNIAQARQQARAQWATIRQRLNQQYPQAMRYAGSVWTSMQRIHDQWFSSLNGALRRTGVPAFEELADMFNKTPGTAPKTPMYFDELQRRRAEFATKINTAFDGATDQEIQQAMAELIALNGRAGQHQTNVAKAVRAVLDELHTYMVEGGLLMQHVDNYFPKIWDHERVKAGEQEIRTLLANAGVDPASIDRIFEHMLEHDGAEATFQRNIHPRAHIAGEPSNQFLKGRSEVLQDPAFDKFLSQDPRRTMERYVNAAVKRTEFNRLLGEDARQTGQNWDPRAKWLALLKRAQAQGATQEQLDFANDAIEAMLGRYGRNTPDRVRRIMAWIATYQNLRVLGFSQLASLPDLVGPALRSGEYQRAFDVLRGQMKNITNNQSDLAEAGRVWGIISDTLNQHVLTEHYDTHWFPERARRINDSFFRAIGMEKLNNFVRSYALAVGMDFIQRRAAAAINNNDAAARRDLDELGVSAEDVIDWVAGGRKIYGSAKTTLGTTKPHDERVARALVRFVNEANMRPNPSSRPLMASHPALMLVWHLKSYMFSFYDVFIRQIMLNAQRAGTPWQKAYVVAVPAALMLALTAAGLELRELIQYKIWGAEGRTERMTGSEYTWELLQRSGLFGPSQLLVDWEEANERGTAGLIAIGGPTLGQLADAVSQKPSTTVVKAIPGVNQMPELRKWLTEQIASE